MFSRTATCKYNYPAVPLSLWIATHAPYAAVPRPSLSLSSYSTVVSNLIPRLFSPILSSSPSPPTLRDFSSRLTSRILPLRPGVPFCSGRFAHALSLVSSFKLPSAFPFSRRHNSLPQPLPALPFRASSCPYSSRTSLAVFTLIVAVLLNPLRIVCAKDAAVVQRKLARGSKTHPRYPPTFRHAILFIFQPVACEIGFHGCVNMVKRINDVMS